LSIISSGADGPHWTSCKKEICTEVGRTVPDVGVLTSLHTKPKRAPVPKDTESASEPQLALALAL
jgi:hypothetical protein